MQPISCLCMTYGRPRLLEESIESFNRQVWDGPRELLILNDHPDQPLSLASVNPNIHIINLPRRIRTIGEKRNVAVAMAKHDLLLIWDDDDIYLPNRITETMKILPTKQFFKSPMAWTMQGKTLNPKPNYNCHHGGASYSRWLFEKVGGYSCMDCGEDMDFENAIKVETGTDHWADTMLPSENLYYIYRWGHGSYHATNAKKIADIKPIVNGPEVLVPQWRQDYTALVAANLAKGS